jgi:hypothetical protein
MPTNNAIRNRKFKAIARELNLDDVCWMARRGELLPPSPTPVDDPRVSSHLYGPCMKTVQLERIEVVEFDEYGNVVWEA